MTAVALTELETCPECAHPLGECDCDCCPEVVECACGFRGSHQAMSDHLTVDRLEGVDGKLHLCISYL